jgi:predicted short-subunit dehydrogenase-like oxidoreductase (DUF2520 family)
MSQLSDRNVRVGFVDAGRLGGSLAQAASRAGYRVAAVSRRDCAAARTLASRLGANVLGSDEPQHVVDASDVVFLTTVDDRLEALSRSLAFRDGQLVIHCSGATPVSALDSAARQGARTGGLHPLQTFPDDRGCERFVGVTFGIEASDPSALAWLRDLARDLGGTSVALDASSRPLYHASAVMIGPLTAALAGLACDLWTALGADRDDGLRALAPLLSATADHVTSMGLPAALTGPFVRGDVAPVRAHLDALASVDPDTARAYAALALAQLPLAAERGNIPADRMLELRALLDRALHPDSWTHPRSLRTAQGDQGVAEQNDDT